MLMMILENGCILLAVTVKVSPQRTVARRAPRNIGRVSSRIVERSAVVKIALRTGTASAIDRSIRFAVAVPVADH